MNTVLPTLLLALSLMPAAASAAPAYALSLSVSPSPAALQQVTLPPDVYRHAAYPDLRDLRVLDAADHPQPFAWQPPAPDTLQSLALPLYAEPTSATSAPAADHLQLQRDPGGSLRLELASRTAPGQPPPPAYLIDRGIAPRPDLTALQLNWQARQPDILLTLTIQHGDDLQHWQPLTGPATLARLHSGTHQLSQSRLPLPATTARYLRLQADWPAGFRLTEASGETLRPPQADLQPLPQVAARKATDGGFEFDLGGAFPLHHLQVIYTGPRLLLPAELLSRASPDQPWRRHGPQLVYKLDAQMPPFIVSSTDRYWKLQPDSRIGAPVPAALRLQADYRSRQLVFVPQGQPPYRLQFGDNAQEHPGHLPYATLVPQSDRPTLARASISGPLRSEAGHWASRITHLHWRTLLLWLVLILGVGLMAWMAYRLSPDQGPYPPGQRNR